uniref:Uncharacterized protein n=1 Tax=Rhizophora mucronata TaxID=61149 RepID=A0A2P2PUX5_RHIMU
MGTIKTVTNLTKQRNHAVLKFCCPSGF